MEYKEIDGELHAFETKKDFSEKKQRIFEKRLKEAEIPKDYWNLGFRHAAIGKNKDLVKFCKEYHNNVESGERYNLYLYGPNTTGKSTVACAIGKEFIKSGKNVKFVLAGDLIDILMKCSGFNHVDEFYSIKKMYSKCDLLIIDDIFDEDKSLLWNSPNKHMIVSIWDTFLRKFISNDGRLITTSNIMLEQVGSKFSKSLYELFVRNFKIMDFQEKSIKDIRKKTLNI